MYLAHYVGILLFTLIDFFVYNVLKFWFSSRQSKVINESEGWSAFDNTSNSSNFNITSTNGNHDTVFASDDPFTAYAIRHGVHVSVQCITKTFPAKKEQVNFDVCPKFPIILGHKRRRSILIRA